MGFLARAVPRELAATAQGFVATWSGIVSASATLASGFVYAASGSLAYLVMAAMALVGLASALYAAGSRRSDQRSRISGSSRPSGTAGYIAISSEPRRNIILDDSPPRELIHCRTCCG